jgi:hypothetical protein
MLTCFSASGFDTIKNIKMESTFIPKPNTLLSKAMEFKEQEQSMDVEEGTKEGTKVVYRRRKMRCTGTQTL